MKSLSKIRVFDVCRQGSHVLGPGCRYIVWTQGCKRHCFGCLTPESQPINGGFEISISDLAADIIQNKSINGITISGGEPMLQLQALEELLKLVHDIRPELTVIVYTGDTFETIEKDILATNLLKHIDILIDGPYIESLNDGRGIRGSSNQRVIPISHRLDPYLDYMTMGTRHIERIALDSNYYTTIGIPPKINKI